ncbi:hypothetical protein ACUIA4_10360 [Vibrio parahaemolyticus]
MNNRRVLIKAGMDSRVTLLVGWALGALTNIFPIYSVIVFSITAFVVFAYVYKDKRKEQIELEISNEEVMRLALPDSDTQRAASKTALNLLVSDKVAEIVWHPNLNAAVSPENVGWDPSDIEVEPVDLEFDCSILVQAAGGLVEVEPPNNKKYSLVNMPFVSAESEHIKLTLRNTDYQTVETIKRWAELKPTVLEQLGHINPQLNRLPSSLCLHYTVRLGDGRILLMKRVDGVGYHPSKWSATGEEQLSESDLNNAEPIKNLFLRALGEEVLHLGNIDEFRENITCIEKHIQYMRVYSIGVEYPLYNPALFGFAQLRDTTEELRQRLIQRKYGITSLGHEDPEGTFYTVSLEEAYTLLSQGSVDAISLFGSKKQRVYSEKLHPSTRYRLFRLIRTHKRQKLLG